MIRPCGIEKHAKVRAKTAVRSLQHLPSLFVLVSIISSFIFGTKLSTIPFVLFGTYSAWIYLRFLQLKPELSVRCAGGLLAGACGFWCAGWAGRSRQLISSRNVQKPQCSWDVP